MSYHIYPPSGGGGGSPDWGDIGGTLSDQTDLQDALNLKENISNKSVNLTSPDNTKYPTTLAVSTALSGKVDTSRTISTTAPLAGGGNLSSNLTLSIPQATGSADGYLTSTDWTTFNNKQAAGNYITALTGDVTASGPGSAAATIANNAVTTAKINNSAVTYAKMQNGGSLSVVGRSANSSGVLNNISAGTNHHVLRRSGTTLGFGLLVNDNIDASAAIAQSKLNLSITNAEVNASAAIAYSKLNLTGSIVNADVSSSAAIAYSKLNLTGSIVNADINSSAAIAVSKLAAGSNDQVLTTVAGVPTWAAASGGGAVYVAQDVVNFPFLGSTFTDVISTPSLPAGDYVITVSYNAQFSWSSAPTYASNAAVGFPADVNYEAYTTFTNSSNTKIISREDNGGPVSVAVQSTTLVSGSSAEILGTSIITESVYLDSFAGGVVKYRMKESGLSTGIVFNITIIAQEV